MKLISMKSYFLTILFAVGLIACQSEASSSSIGLRKLKGHEIIDRVKNNTLYNDEIVFKKINGSIISRDSLVLYNEATFFADYYADASGQVKEVIMRKVTPEDQELMQKIEEAGKRSTKCLWHILNFLLL